MVVNFLRVLQPQFPRYNASRFIALSMDSAAEAEVSPVLVQYVVIRKDLIDEMKWALGSVISQGCHAAVAATWLYKDDPETIEYCSPKNMNAMHKVTLEVKGESELLSLAHKLEEAQIPHKLWIEEPENIPTCLATKPSNKSLLSIHFKRLKLFK